MLCSTAIIHNHPIHYKHLLFTALAARGLEFEVLFTGSSSEQRLEIPLPTEGEYRYRVGFNGPYEMAKGRATRKFVWNSLNELQPLTVIISGYYDYAAWTAWVWAQLNGAGRVLWAESNEFDRHRNFLKELPKRVFVGNCDMAHVYGQSSLAYIEKLGMPRERIGIKGAVADTERFLKTEITLNLREGPKRLLYVGRFADEKNLAFLLRSFSDMRQDNEHPLAVLSLVGYGPKEAQLKDLVKNLGIEKLVRFPGKALQAQLPSLYREADVFILPSMYEPWGLVANEAMLSGLPVMLSTQCGCTADLAQCETGWKFSPWDQNALTELLREVVVIPRERLREMGIRARQLAAQYSPENCARVVSEMVTDLARRRGQRRIVDESRLT